MPGPDRSSATLAPMSPAPTVSASVGSSPVIAVTPSVCPLGHIAFTRFTECQCNFCHPYDQPEVCTGQSTPALELLDQTGPLDTVILAVGRGAQWNVTVLCSWLCSCPSTSTSPTKGQPVQSSPSGHKGLQWRSEDH